MFVLRETSICCRKQNPILGFFVFFIFVFFLAGVDIELEVVLPTGGKGNSVY